MSDDVEEQELPVHGRLSQPPEDEFRLAETAVLEHRGGRYDISLVGDDLWVIRGVDGRTMGSLYVMSPAGEEGEPVYAVRLAGETEPYHEGTDWRSLAATAINVALDA